MNNVATIISIITLIVVVVLPLIAVPFGFYFIKKNKAKFPNEEKNKQTIDGSNSSEQMGKIIQNGMQPTIAKINDQMQSIKYEADQAKTYRTALEESMKKNFIDMDKKLSSLNNFEKKFFDTKNANNIGELQLKAILSYVYGSKDNLYGWQKQLSNGKKPDAIVYGIDQKNNIAIDAKCSTITYKNYLNADSEIERTQHMKDLEEKTRRQIKDLKKYHEDVDISMVILYLPVEKMFYDLTNNSKIIEEAQRNKIIIASPTTLLSILNNLDLYHKEIKLIKAYENQLTQLKNIKAKLERTDAACDKTTKKMDGAWKEQEKLIKSLKETVQEFEQLDGMQNTNVQTTQHSLLEE